MKQALQKLTSKEMFVQEAAEYFDVPKRSLPDRMEMIRIGSEIKLKPNWANLKIPLFGRDGSIIGDLH
jgi:hypothetical protein